MFLCCNRLKMINNIRFLGGKNLEKCTDFWCTFLCTEICTTQKVCAGWTYWMPQGRYCPFLVCSGLLLSVLVCSCLFLSVLVFSCVCSYLVSLHCPPPSCPPSQPQAKAGWEDRRDEDNGETLGKNRQEQTRTDNNRQ